MSRRTYPGTATWATVRDSADGALRLQPPPHVQAALETVRAFAQAELARRPKRRSMPSPEATG